MNDFVTIRIFDDYIAASLASQKLEEAGINHYIADENTIAVNWIYRNAVGGIKLRVPENEKEAALKILLDERVDKIEVDHTIESDGIMGDKLLCPNCGSNNIGTEKISKRSVGISWLILGFPISLNLIKQHRCFYCEHTWET